MKLGKNVFVALAAITWADGEMTEGEAAALLHAARGCGVTGDDLEDVEKATKEKVDITELKKLSLTPQERIFTYAIATWLARVDGVVMPEEKMMLAKLGDHLKLADGDRTRASAASFEAAGGARAERTSLYDLPSLAAQLDAALSNA